MEISRRTFMLGAVIGPTAGVPTGVIGPTGGIDSGPVGPVGTGSFSSQVIQFFDRLITIPTPARQVLYANLIDGLVADGVWAKLDALYIFAAADSGTALINLVQGSFDATLWQVAGIPTFAVDKGFTGAGINRNVNSNFVPSTASGHFTQNDAMVGAWNLTSGPAQTQPIVILENNTENIEIWPRYTADFAFFSMNEGNAGGDHETAHGSVTDASGFWLAQRTASNAEEMFRNDVSLKTATAASQALASQAIHFGLPWQTSTSAIGASLPGTLHTSLYTRQQTYLQAVGAI